MSSLGTIVFILIYYIVVLAVFVDGNDLPVPHIIRTAPFPPLWKGTARFGCPPPEPPP
jgi:hypothetical protein